MEKMLVVMSHPDDETFGPGATIAKYAARGVEIHLLCATRGENGQWSDVKSDKKLGEVREEEHRKAAKILGIKSVEYLGYIDGTLSNLLMNEVVEKIYKKIGEFKPEVILTMDTLGISGHLDHIFMSLAATRAFEESDNVSKLYYFAVPKDFTDEVKEKTGRTMWGRDIAEIKTMVSVADYLNQKLDAAKEHLTQKADLDRMLPFWQKYGGVDNFIRAGSRVSNNYLEEDLFDGIA